MMFAENWDSVTEIDVKWQTLDIIAEVSNIYKAQN